MIPWMKANRKGGQITGNVFWCDEEGHKKADCSRLSEYKETHGQVDSRRTEVIQRWQRTKRDREAVEAKKKKTGVCGVTDRFTRRGGKEADDSDDD
jgi:hypothetical protein